MAHEFAKVAQRGLNQEMEVILHQYKTVEDDAVGGDRLRENLQKCNPVDIILTDGLSLVTTVRNMIKSTWILNTQWSGHRMKIP